jgi:cytochrome c553
MSGSASGKKQRSQLGTFGLGKMTGQINASHRFPPVELPLQVTDDLEDGATSSRFVLTMATGAAKTRGLLAAWHSMLTAHQLTALTGGQSNASYINRLLNGPVRRKIGDVLDVQPASAAPLLVPQPYAPRPMRAHLSRDATYRARCRRILRREQDGLHNQRRQRTVESRWRDNEARRAVLDRCDGHCENPNCLLPNGKMPYRSKAGDPLLHVDHVDGHASGGRDYPDSMIALCATCHDNKTRGMEAAALTELLRVEALRRHQALMRKL